MIRHLCVQSALLQTTRTTTLFLWRRRVRRRRHGDRMKKIQDIKHTAELRKLNKEKEKADSIEFFSALMHSIERCQVELLEKMEEKQKAAEKQEEVLIEELQQITELKRRDSELEQLSHTEDHLHLIQSFPAMFKPFNTKQWPDTSVNTPVSLNTIRAALTQLQQTLDEKLNQTVDVTLDPDTAHPELILSDDGKQESCGNITRDVPDNPERFDYCIFVLGKEGFSSGRFYFEVQVKKKAEWNLGVARESVIRKGDITLAPQNGYWAIWLRNEDAYKALEAPRFTLSESEDRSEDRR